MIPLPGTKCKGNCMRSLAKLSKLIHHYQVKKEFCLQKVTHCNQKIIGCRHKIDRLRSDHELLFLILKKKKLKGYITFIALYEFRRKEAMIKRRMAEINAQIKNELLEKNSLEQELIQLKKEFKFCHQHVNRYQMLNNRYHLKKMEQNSRIEESFIEELIYGQAGKYNAV